MLYGDIGCAIGDKAHSANRQNGWYAVKGCAKRLAWPQGTSSLTARDDFYQQYLAMQLIHRNYDAMQQFNAHEATAAALLSQAVNSKVQVRVRYNGAEMVLDPYQIFERHGALYLSAFNPHKNRPNEKSKELGHFRIAGLKEIQLADPFTPLPELDRKMSRDEDRLLLAID